MTNRTLAALVAVGLAACSSNSGDAPAAITEHDLAADPTLAVGIGQVGVTFLEPADAASTVSDTGGSGVDVMAIDLPAGTTYTLGLDPEDVSATIALVELLGHKGETRIRLTPAVPSGTVFLEPGRYTLMIHAAYRQAEAEGDDHRTVFLRPPAEPLAVGAGTLAPGPGAMDATPATVNRLVTTKSCDMCDLRGAKLAGAKLRSARMTLAKLDRADLSSADLSWAMMLKASLVGAKLTSANLTTTNLTQADLTGADVTGATLEHTILDHAKWTDGRICKSTSIGACN